MATFSQICLIWLNLPGYCAGSGADATSGYKYSVAFSLCGGCDVRVDCGLAAIDEEPQPWAQYLIRGGVTASRRGKLMEQHKAAVAGRPAALYKRMCGNNRCGSVVGSTDPETSLCRECRNVSEVPQAA